MSNQLAIAILAKNPIPGRVKTRLARTVGEEEATRIYEQLYYRTLAEVSSLARADAFIYQAPNIDRELVKDYSIEARLQSKGDLGERMNHAMEELLSDYSAVLLVGEDCPLISSELMDRAFDGLSAAEVTLGPSEDGGFYLIGATQSVPQLFLQRQWSHDQVFSDSLDIAEKQGLSLFILKELYDIDRESDWQRWQAAQT
jgi:rSAM/selenodomain-associated transferase 1